MMAYVAWKFYCRNRRLIHYVQYFGRKVTNNTTFIDFIYLSPQRLFKPDDTFGFSPRLHAFGLWNWPLSRDPSTFGSQDVPAVVQQILHVCFIATNQTAVIRGRWTVFKKMRTLLYYFVWPLQMLSKLCTHSLHG